MAKHEMNRRKFGISALNDPNFFYDLKAGRRTPSIETAQKVEDFMVNYKPYGRRATDKKRAGAQ